MEEDFKHPEMTHSSGVPVELDVFVESLKLAFEYQGEQHYRPIYSLGGDYLAQKQRDNEKIEGCKGVSSIFFLVIWFSIISR